MAGHLKLDGKIITENFITGQHTGITESMLVGALLWMQPLRYFQVIIMDMNGE